LITVATLIRLSTLFIYNAAVKVAHVKHEIRMVKLAIVKKEKSLSPEQEKEIKMANMSRSKAVLTAFLKKIDTVEEWAGDDVSAVEVKHMDGMQAVNVADIKTVSIRRNAGSIVQAIKIEMKDGTIIRTASPDKDNDSRVLSIKVDNKDGTQVLEEKENLESSVMLKDIAVSASTDEKQLERSAVIASLEGFFGSRRIAKASQPRAVGRLAAGSADVLEGLIGNKR